MKKRKGKEESHGGKIPDSTKIFWKTKNQKKKIYKRNNKYPG